MWSEKIRNPNVRKTEDVNDASWDEQQFTDSTQEAGVSVGHFTFVSEAMERGKESPHNCLSPLLDKTVTANNAWGILIQTNTPFFSLISAFGSINLVWVWASSICETCSISSWTLNLFIYRPLFVFTAFSTSSSSLFNLSASSSENNILLL